MENLRLVSQDRVEVLLEVLGRDDLEGINEAWKLNLLDCLNTITQLRLEALEHDRAEELFRKEAMELRDVAVWSISKLRGVINGIERKGRDRQAQTDRGVVNGRCESVSRPVECTVRLEQVTGSSDGRLYRIVPPGPTEEIDSYDFDTSKQSPQRSR